jgi:molybdenum cofactor biosynthesis enzyme MoaA
MYEFFRHLSCPLGFTLDGAFISCLNADRAIRLKNLEKDLQNSHSDKERLVKKVLNKMDETSNPILIIYDFK